MSKIGVGVIGYGTIGAGVIDILQKNRALIQSRTGKDIELKVVADIDFERPRSVAIQTAKKTTNYKEIFTDPDVQIVVELVGGIDFAYKVVDEALRAGKNVVTANKALLAEKGGALFALAEKQNKSIGFEASVAGGIPIIRTVSSALVGDEINAIYGIVNGTTNYILTKMFEEEWAFDVALKKAQELGFAEADPTLDVGGFDAAHKIAILAALAFNNELNYDKAHIEGIDKIQLEDVKYAAEMGYVMKLLGIAKKDSSNTVELRVHPTLVARTNQLAAVRNEFNGILIDSEYLGTSMYYGRGAGAKPTATAVVSDIVSIAKSLENPTKTTKYTAFNKFSIKSMGDTRNRYYLRFNVSDKVGVLTRISGVFAEENISISSVIQKEPGNRDFVPLVLTTHIAAEKDMMKALDRIEKMDFSKSRGIMYRIME